jgi:glutamate dehydrogenase/leucine dehydrogenase
MVKNIKENIQDIGPSKIIQLYFPVSDFRAIVVVDNTALGPSIGGVRVSLDVSVEEVKRLARTMTMKTSVAGLSHGGGKAGIIADPSSPKKELYFRVFAQAIKDIKDYIPGPDMGSNEECMAWIHDEIGRVAGLPEEIGGLPLDKLGATGFGLAECAEVACNYANIELNGARVAIQGFGSVGKAAAKFLSKRGCVLVAASDTKGCIFNANGIDVKELIDAKEYTGSVINYKNGKIKKNEEIFSLDCDILIPAATPDVIHIGNVYDIKARLILQGANIPATLEAEEMLHKRDVLSIPDFIANAGGVIMAAAEYAKKSEDEAFNAISEKIKKNTKVILEKTFNEGILPRQAAEVVAMERVLKAMSYKRVL